MKPNFTPGPWDCISKKEHEKICRKYPAAYMVVPITCVGDKMVMPLTTALRWLPERRKNAYLIAAAPEMYDCLKEAVKKVCIDSNCHAYNAGECMNAAGFCRAQKWINTLKKARGEK